MIAHFKKLGLFADSAIDLAVFSGINSGVDGASDVMITSEVFAPLQIEANQTVINGYDFTIDLRTLRNAGVTESQIYNFSQQITTGNLELAILGISACLVSLPDWKLIFNDKISTNTYNDFMLTKRVTGMSYNASGVKNSGLHLGVNLLGLYEVNAGDGTDLYGFNAGGDVGMTRSESAGVVTLTDVIMSGLAYYNTFYAFFPFVGESLTFSIEVTAISTSTATLDIAYYDEDKVLIGSGTSVPIATSAGIKSVSMIAPSGTAYVRGVIVFTPDPSGAISFKNPMIALNGNTTFTMR